MGLVYASHPIGNHFQEIQALTVIDSNLPPENLNTPNQAAFFFPIFFFILLCIGVFGWQFYSRLKDFSRILMVLAVGLVLGMVPLTVNILNSRSTNTLTKAVTDFTPQRVILEEVGPNEYRLSWRTQVPTYGAVKLSTARDMKTNTSIIKDGRMNLVHSHTLTQLKPGITYYIEILSDTRWYNHQGQPIIITAK
jgi:uncharacterized membrane protein